MVDSPLLYYITDRAAFTGDERTRHLRLLDKIAEAASHGVDYVQLREKDLPARDLESLAREAMSIINPLRTENPERRKERGKERGTALLINSRTDVAMAVAANGVHLPAGGVSPEEVRAAWKCGAGVPFDMLRAGSARDLSPHDPLIAVSCHSPQEVFQAAANHATFAVFAPVFEKKIFEKKDSPATIPAGLDALREACRAEIPVLALGGVTLQNAEPCLRAGAAGIAAIRLFQENDIATIVRELRG
ncbi:MAG TPA: thiamine phosphate synthase [Candidatus Eremiobacteraceae bacterium]|nr:thiamine phosphate synthase [Candidatus Eremiobacteraceae bacterium]